MNKQKTTQEIIEDVMDEFNFIECHEKNGYYSKKRIRDLKNEAEEAINGMVSQIEELEKEGKSKFNVMSYHTVNSFLAIGYYAEAIDISGFPYEEGYRIALYHISDYSDHLTY